MVDCIGGLGYPRVGIVSAELWDEEEHGVSYEDLSAACAEYISLITMMCTLLRAYRNTRDENLIEIMDHLVEDYDVNDPDYYDDVEIDEGGDDGQRH